MRRRRASEYRLATAIIAMGAATNITMVAAAEVAVLSPNTVRSVVTAASRGLSARHGISVRFTFL